MAGQVHQGEVAGTRWDPGQYTRFGDHRLRPALELLERTPLDEPAVVYDLGCGTGKVTRMIAERWPSAEVYGLDNSPEMLALAAKETSRVRWIEADVRTWSPAEAPDLIYSNAALQWLDDHRALFPRLAGFVKPQGCLAVQMPLSWGMRSHELMREVLENGGPGGTSLGNEFVRQAVARNWVGEPAAYYDLLVSESCTPDIWTTEYIQVLEGKDPVVEWVKGTGLRPILHGLDDGERPVFLAEYTRRVAEAYPVRGDGRTLYPFKRLFMVATQGLAH